MTASASITAKAGFGEREFSFTEQDFQKVRKLIYQHAGISLSDVKGDMVYSRLARRLRVIGLSSFAEYLAHLERVDDAREWEAFTNALTTNLTAFFRESHHFPILAEHLRRVRAPITIWCSASSTVSWWQGRKAATSRLSSCWSRSISESWRACCHDSSATRLRSRM